MNIVLGFLFLLIGAACGGSFGLPSKFARKDTPWEVLWGPFFFFVTILLPVVLGPMIVKDFGSVYGGLRVSEVLPVLVFGFLWGLGSMTLGMSFAFIGLSLAYALNYGAQIMTGAVLTMAIFTPEHFGKTHGIAILVGVAVCLVGVIVAGRAGILKERGLKEGAAPPPPEEAASAKKPRMLPGLIVGIASGILCACWAVAAGYTDPVAAAATASGNTPVPIGWARTCLILWGGVLSACGYCALRLTRNKTWGQLLRPSIVPTLVIALVMALLHDGAVLFYALGASKLGTLGVSVGYAAFMSFAIIVGNLHGFWTGEWKGASRQSMKWIGAAILILILGVCVLATGNALQQRAARQAPTTTTAQ